MSVNQKISRQNFEDLAKLLAINYINSSVGIIDDLESKKNEHKSLKKILENYITTIEYSEIRGINNWKRVILVVGAGASFNAFNNIMLGNQAKKDICKQFKFTISNNKEINFWDIIKETVDLDSIDNDKQSAIIGVIETYKKEYNKLKINNPNRFHEKVPDFENTLLLLSHFFPVSTIRKKLFELYEFRHGPTLCNDIISHLLKHRFIDTIINFNFDELLDQAISDELGEKYFNSILSDGDIKHINEFLVDKRLKKPIYIKPHGTYSHKSSLRFTKNHYDLIPEDMKSFLENMITCEKDIGFADSSVLIVLGFAMESVEFDDILLNLKRKITVYYFEYDKEKAIKIKEKYENINKKGQPNIIDVKLIVLSHIQRSDYPFIQLDSIFEQLFNQISTYFKDGFKPKSISRHKLIQQFFSSRKLYEILNKKHLIDSKNGIKKSHILNKTYFESKDYFLDRSKLEILIELMKKQGQVSIKYLLNTKAGNYFFKYHHLSLNPIIANEKKTPESFLNILNSLNLEHSFLEDLCRVPNNDWMNVYINLKLTKGIFNHLDTIKLLKRYKNLIGKSTKSTIRTNYNKLQYLLFKKYKPEQLIHTRLSYDYELLKEMNKQWYYIIIIEDFNTIYESSKERIRSKNIVLINSEDAPLIKKDGSDKIHQLRIPHKDHNHHCVLFMTRFKKKAIYYYQEGLSNSISPIVIKEPENLKIIDEVILNYLRHSHVKGQKISIELTNWMESKN